MSDTSAPRSRKITLTDRGIRAAKPAAPGKRYDLWDIAVPSFGCRVTDKGHKTFVVMKRVGGKPAVRHRLGNYPAMTLETARTQARTVLEEMSRGIHPKARKEAERQAREEARRAKEEAEQNRFAVAAEDFLKRHVSTLRSHKAVEAAVRRELIPQWGSRMVSEITRRDVIRRISEVAEKSGPYAAHKLLAYCSKLFNWAISQDAYGLDRSPCDRIRPADLIGRKEARQRVLSDAELRLFWQAARDTPYPFGPLWHALALTGQRLNELAGATWSEIDLEATRLIVPADRMKGKAPHVVPLSPEMLGILEGLPRFTAGDHAFTTTDGQRPVSGFSKAKTRLNRAIAGLNGDQPIAPWRLHDVRRSVRTRFSAIPVEDPIVRELAIGHTQTGVRAVYDLHRYEREKRELLDAWAKRLLVIVEPPPSADVVTLRRR